MYGLNIELAYETVVLLTKNIATRLIGCWKNLVFYLPTLWQGLGRQTCTPTPKPRTAQIRMLGRGSPFLRYFRGIQNFLVSLVL